MAILCFEGFEGGVLTPEFSGVDLTTGTARTGVGYYEADSTLTCTMPSSATRVTVGFALSPAANVFTGGPFSICQLRDTAGTVQLTLGQVTGQTVKLYRGTTAGTQIADTGFLWTPGAWHYVEIQATLADAGGTCIVHIDEIEVVNFTGDTRNSGALGSWGSLTFLNNIAGGSFKVDDIYVLDQVDDTATTGRVDNTFLGAVRVEPLYPNGDGASSQWVGSDGNSVNNYLLVDEASANTSDYVGSPTTGNRDLYALQNTGASTTTAMAVRASLYASKSDIGTIGLKPILKENNGTGSEFLGSQIVPGSVAYTHYWDTIRKTKPSGGAWSKSDVDALQVGVEVTTGL